MIGTTLEHSLPANAGYEKTDLYSQTVKRGINWIFAIALVTFILALWQHCLTFGGQPLLYFSWYGFWRRMLG